MKPNSILCLVLVLSGVLSGCSGMRNRTSADVRHEGALFSNQEAVCLKSDDPARPWRLKWALTEETWNTGELFLTVHERRSAISPDYDPESTAAIFVKAGGKLKLLKRLEATEHVSHFLKPTVVWAAVKGEDREQLIQITEEYYGTGHLTEEHVFTTVVTPVSDLKFAPGLKLDEVEFVPADALFKERLAKGEGVWKGVTSTFTGQGLYFDFAIWKDGDGNCCPSAGKVAGAYKLERKPDGGLRISMDTCKREPVQETE